MHEAFIEVKPSSGRTFSYPLEQTSIKIGRDHSADLVIDDPLLSKLHARIERKGDKWFLIDEGSRNGTFIAGKRAPEKKELPLKDGDDITLGLTALTFHLGEADEKAPPTRRLMRTTQEYFSVHDLLGKVGTVDLPEPLLKLLVRLSEEVLPESEPVRIYQAALRIATDLLGSSRSAVLTQPRDGELTVAARYPEGTEFEIPPHFYAAVVERRGVVLIRDEKKPDAPSAMALPLFSPTGVAGVLYAEKQGGQSFSNGDATFGSVIASLVGPSLYQAQRLKNLFAERQQLLSQLRTRRAGDEGSAYLTGSSSALLKLREQISAAARHTRATLIVGEVGTGKEAVARAIHSESSRRDRAFVPVLCAALTPDTLTRELLGDGSSSKPSLYQLAVGGTLFLDDVSVLPASVQQDLVRVLTQNPGEASPRVVASSTLGVDAMLKAKSLIEPFAQMLTVSLTTPALRERREDIAGMARLFVQQHSANLGKSVTMSPEALNALERADFRGNVRDLSHAIERAMIVVADGGTIDDRHVSGGANDSETETLKDAVGAFERQFILRVLADQHGHRTRTAKVLGLSRQALSEKLRKYGLKEKEEDSEE